MLSRIKTLLQGYPQPTLPPDFDDTTIALFNAVQPFTMTSPERIVALRASVEYVLDHDIPGDIVECGVWKGGSMMAVALTLQERRATRQLHLFDTFAGMSEPTSIDKDFKGIAASDQLAKVDTAHNLWAIGSVEEVKRNLASTAYDLDNVSFIVGKVEDTIPANAPKQIALLRLDTDWYESTYHEMVHLFPRLTVGGVLIIDDYGHWQGARRAVDQYIQEKRLRLLLNRIDYTCRLCIKLEP